MSFMRHIYHSIRFDRIFHCKTKGDLIKNVSPCIVEKLKFWANSVWHVSYIFSHSAPRRNHLVLLVQLSFIVNRFGKRKNVNSQEKYYVLNSVSLCFIFSKIYFLTYLSKLKPKKHSGNEFILKILSPCHDNCLF